jgi:hypothetical protein
MTTVSLDKRPYSTRSKPLKPAQPRKQSERLRKMSRWVPAITLQILKKYHIPSQQSEVDDSELVVQPASHCELCQFAYPHQASCSVPSSREALRVQLGSSAKPRVMQSWVGWIWRPLIWASRTSAFSLSLRPPVWDPAISESAEGVPSLCFF